MSMVAQPRFDGQVIRPGDAGYDDARALWNGMIDRRPALIVRCAGVDDVGAAVNHAREENLPLAVRGGGHNAAGNALCDDGLVIDLSAMRAVEVDPVRRVARAQGAPRGATSTRRPLRTAWPRPVVRFRRPASADSPLAVASAC